MEQQSRIGLFGCALVFGGSVLPAGCEHVQDPGFSFATGAEGFAYIRPAVDHNAVVQGMLDLTSDEQYALINSGGRSTSRGGLTGPREAVYTTAWWLVEHEPTGRRFEFTQITEADHPRQILIHEVDATGDYVRASDGDAVLVRLTRDATNAFAYWQDPSSFPLRRDRDAEPAG